ncbi:hypothetical protein [Pseudomonas sp. W2-17]|uniref:hypothetical protein n=1 Tax=Pseudomonas sp. W2-17 TaxID=3058039 RepID=UPI0034E0BAE6
MKKQHGPAFKAQQIELAQCPTCKGRTVVRGVFHDLACVQCNASGWVDAQTGDALPLELLVTALGSMLHQAMRNLELSRRIELLSGPAAIYQQNNRRGAGGSNYTGD